MTSDPYTPLQRRILTLLEEKDQANNPLGKGPPTLFSIIDIHYWVRGDKEWHEVWPRFEINNALHQLEEMNILRSDIHGRESYYGFHPAIIGMPGDHGTTYCFDPDLICDKCGEVQSINCLNH